MKKYIWQNPEYPNFTYDKDVIMPLLASVRLKQGLLIGKMKSLGFENIQNTKLNVLIDDVIKSSEIEGLKLNIEQVRSSVAKKMGLNIGGDIYVERDVQGIVDMMVDATTNYDMPLNEERLFAWNSAMFPSGRSGLYKIRVGAYRDDKKGKMQVVSGALGHEKVHYEAPGADIIPQEMSKLFDFINNESSTDLVIKAGIVHLWFVIIHPFEDGNKAFDVGKGTLIYKKGANIALDIEEDIIHFFEPEPAEELPPPVEKAPEEKKLNIFKKLLGGLKRGKQ